MSAWVVDSSVVLKWFLEESNRERARALLRSEDAFDAPSLMPIEVANVLSKRVRAEIITREYASHCRQILRQVPIRFHATRHLLDRAYEIAMSTGESVYDCLFLALALNLESQVVTADHRFIHGLRSTVWAGRLVWIEDLP